MSLDLARLRADFPLLAEPTGPGGRPLVYLDNAATSHKPRAVLAAVEHFYTRHNANIHRGVHRLSQEATEAYEGARARVARWLNAAHPAEVVFTKGATEALNIVAHGLGETLLGPGDEVLLTELEHHANIVPWQMACERRGARIVPAPIDVATGTLALDTFAQLLGPRTKVVALTHTSNALGTINPVGPMVALARAAGATVVVDACQAVAHGPLDVAALGADYVAFSGHKVFGPTGIGVLWGKRALLDELPPLLGGGDMILTVAWEGSTYKYSPDRFEGGTPPIAGAVGLAAALDYLAQFEATALHAHETALRQAAEAALDAVPGLRRIGLGEARAPVISFVLPGIHPHDVGTFLDTRGVAVRTGHHCCQPLMRRLRLPGTTRASFAFYNTLAEVEALAEAVREAARFF